MTALVLSAPAPKASVKKGEDRCVAPLQLERKNKVLQRNLDEGLEKSRLERYVKKKLLTVAVADLSRDDETYYAGFNDDLMMYAASLPKIAILLANAQAANDGELAWTSEFERKLNTMITESSNPNAAWGVEQVGLKRIEDVVRNPKYCLYDDEHGGLWVGKSYGAYHDKNPDPMKDLSHAATARQAVRFMALLDAKKLVSKGWSDHMLALMGPPKHHHKFVGGLKGVKDVTFLARKSGSWRNWHADVALIQHGEQRYAVAALSELKNGESVMQDVVKVVDRVVMEGKHRKGNRRNV